MRLREISTDARIILKNFVRGSGTEVMQNFYNVGDEVHRELAQRKSLVPSLAIDHTRDSIAQMRDEKIDEQSDTHTAQPHV